MKTKQLLLGLIAVNLLGVGILVISRWWSKPVTALEEPLVSQIAGSASGQPLAAAEFRIPPRPVFETPDDAAVRPEIGQLRELAFDIAEHTVESTRQHPGALCLLGKLHLRNNDLQGARNLWEQALAIDPDFAEAYVDLGHLEEKQGNLERSAEYFAKALEVSPEMLDAYEPLAEALMQQGKFAEAEQQLKRLLLHNPASLAAWCSLGKAQQDLGEHQAAVDSFGQALALDQNSQEAVMGQMNAYRSLGDSASAAASAQSLAKIVAAQPRVAEQRDVVARDVEKMQSLLVFTTQTAAQLLFELGQVEEAVAQLQTGLDSVPEARQLRSQLSELYLSQADIDRAIQVLRVGAEANPDDPNGWMELGLMCIRCRRLDAAEGALRQVIELAPTSDRAYALLAQTQMPAGRDRQAAIENAQLRSEPGTLGRQSLHIGHRILQRRRYRQHQVRVADCRFLGPRRKRVPRCSEED